MFVATRWGIQVCADDGPTQRQHAAHRRVVAGQAHVAGRQGDRPAHEVFVGHRS